MRLRLVALTFLLTGASALLVAADADTTRADEEVLKAAKLGSDGPALLSFFRKRTVSETDEKRLLDLIRRLGDDNFSVREKASADLVAAGPPAVQFLRRAANDPDPEVKRRARDCLEHIEAGANPAVAAAAARLIAARKPAGASAVLLAFLPSASDDLVAEEIRATLAALAERDGKPDPDLVKALSDKSAVRRAAAGAALARIGDQRPAVRKLLKDADVAVRLRVSLALVEAKEKEAVPGLIDLLGELPPEQAWRAEDLLLRLAGEKAPQVSPGRTEEERKKCRDAWAAWWKEKETKTDLAKIDLAGRLTGHLLVMERGSPKGGRNGCVRAFGPDGKERWNINNLQMCYDMQALPGDRVLLTEYTPAVQGRRVTERNARGEVVWEKKVNGIPISAQRLPNGHTLINLRNQLVEVDRDGKEVVTINRPVAYAARKLRDGKIVTIDIRGTCSILDASGKELRSFNIGGRIGTYTGIDVTPDGHILVPIATTGKVVEFTTEGKAVWEAAVQQPVAVSRLPNGHVLVCCPSARRVVELDQRGKEVWSKTVDGMPYRAYRR